jgi:hypothetical protein
MQEREIINILLEIRDTHREHLAEYRKTAEQLLAFQTEARNRQQQLTKLYMRVLLVGGALVIVLLVLLFYFILHW